MKFVETIGDVIVTLYHFTFNAPTQEHHSDLSICHPGLDQVLSPTEIQTASKFKFPQHRDRYIFAHIKLREGLAEHLLIDPQEIEFQTGEHGKPKIATHQNPDNIQFNLSHSEDEVLIGITLEHPIGVDIEVITDRGNIDIAERFFAKDEVKHLKSTIPENFQQEFYWIWTRKEAVVKCAGLGLSMGLDTFSVLSDELDGYQLKTVKNNSALISAAVGNQ